MAQHDYDIANQTGSSFRADLNNALDAIVSNNSGSSEPSTTFAYEWWIDTSNNLLKLRNSANNAWITLPLSITADNATSGALTVNGNLSTTGNLDVNGGELILDADADTSITADTDDQIDFRIGAVDVMQMSNSSSDLVLKNPVQDKDILFKGNDGGSEITAFTLDMSSAGKATFNDDVVMPKNLVHTGDSDTFIGFPSDDTFSITTNSSERMRINSSGNVGLGTTAPLAPLHIKRDSSETNLIIQSNVGGSGSSIGGRLRLQLGAQTNTGSGADDTQAGDTLGQIMFEGQGTDFSYQGGNITCKVQTGDGDDGRANQGTFMAFETINVGSVSPAENFRIAQDGTLTATDTTIGSNSDSRIKKNITDFTGGLDLVKSLKPRTFEYKDTSGKRKPGTRRGFIAQEVLKVDDYWIYEQEANDKDDVEYEFTKDTEKVYVSNLTDKDAMYVSAIKELQQQIEALQAKINIHKGEKNGN